MNSENAASRLIDQQSIREVVLRLCQALDRKDIAGIRNAYHVDATDVHGAFEGNVDSFIAWFEKRHAPIPFSMHMVGNILIDFVDESHALAETYNWVVQTYPESAKDSLAQFVGKDILAKGGEFDFLGCGRYLDRFEKRNGEWKILRRTLVSGRKIVLPASVLHEPHSGWITDRRDADDALYTERRTMGIN
jgi:SnoaL-like protein